MRALERIVDRDISAGRGIEHGAQHAPGHEPGPLAVDAPAVVAATRSRIGSGRT
jgi:hypothetical protein